MCLEILVFDTMPLPVIMKNLKGSQVIELNMKLKSAGMDRKDISSKSRYSANILGIIIPENMRCWTSKATFHQFSSTLYELYRSSYPETKCIFFSPQRAIISEKLS